MKSDFVMLGNLIGRNIKIFLKDKASVFFSLLAPLIALMIYVFFLGDVQMDNVRQAMQGAPVDEKYLRAFVDGWLFAGLMGVSCITVSFSANSVAVQDKARGTISDLLISPVKSTVIQLSYLIYNVVVTLTICLIVLTVALVYIACNGWYLSVGGTFAILGNTVFSVLSAATVCVLIGSFVKSEAALGGMTGIISAAIGFLVGAYFPLAMLPKWIQYVVLFLPGTYSTGIFRTLFMGGALDKIGGVVPQAEDALREAFSMKIDFFGIEIGADKMALILFAFTVFFGAIYVIARVVADKTAYLQRRSADAKKGKTA